MAAIVATTLLAGAAQGQSASTPPGPQLEVVVPEAGVRPGTLLLPKGTLVRLMVLDEVSTRTSKPGDRFVLRVDEAVKLGDTTAIPIGAKAWGEVVSADESGAVGKSGKLSARLLYVEAPGGRIPVTGDAQSKGAKSGDRVAMAVLGFGILGLLARGNQGKLKAGDIFDGYTATAMVLDPASGHLEENTGSGATAPQ